MDDRTETPIQREAERSSRRTFFKRAGGVTGVAALLIAGCDTGPFGDDDDDDDNGNGNGEADVTLDFSTDTDVLNYAYALEQLEAAFYAEAVANPSDELSETEAAYLQDLAAHEAIHRDFFAAVLGGDAIPNLEVDFSGIDFSSRDDVLGTAQQLEDLGVSAYNGAGRYISDDSLLTIAGKIVSVEGRHAAAIRAISNPDDPEAFADLGAIELGAVPDSALDAALDPQSVLDAVADTGFVTTTIAAQNT